MAFSHLALAVRDLAANHRFWTDAMGFALVEVLDVPTGVGDGWARHVIYDTGDGTHVGVLELHDDTVPDHDPAISRGLGLPGWVNHIAFDAPDGAALDAARDRWLAFGLDVVQIDHGRALSIYAEDPNGNTIEWSWLHHPFTAEDRARAAGLLEGPRREDPGSEPALEVFSSALART